MVAYILMTSRKHAIAPVVMGLIAFIMAARNPRFEAFHTVDILLLMVSGMCLGIALMALMGRLRPR